MIDISKFVNSKDILRYWEEIDCIKDFTPIQLAYIVYQNYFSMKSYSHRRKINKMRKELEQEEQNKKQEDN